MPRIHPLHLFPPHIAERNLLYFQQARFAMSKKLPSGVTSWSLPPTAQRSSEPHFQTTFCPFAKQIFSLPSPQTSSEPVNFPCFNNFLEANHARYLPTPPISAPYRRTWPAVFSAGQSSRCPKNFRRALSGGGVRFGTL